MTYDIKQKHGWYCIETRASNGELIGSYRKNNDPALLMAEHEVRMRHYEATRKMPGKAEMEEGLKARM